MLRTLYRQWVMRNKGVGRSIPFRLLQPNEEATFNRIGEVGLTWHPSLNTEENRSPQMRNENITQR
jgi:hypothetical protein